MDKKLTLSLDSGVIERAKDYAKSNNISLSKLIETYLSALTRKGEKPIEITPLVESLTGVIDLPEDFEEKVFYTEYLENKYK